jgi:hypothetical protein
MTDTIDVIRKNIKGRSNQATNEMSKTSEEEGKASAQW